MKYFLLSVLLLVGLACKNTQKAPANLLDHQEMLPVLTDIHLIEGYQNQFSKIGDTIPAQLLVEYDAVFEKHSIDPNAFADSYEYYAKYDTSTLIEVYDSLLIIFEDLQANVNSLEALPTEKSNEAYREKYQSNTKKTLKPGLE